MLPANFGSFLSAPVSLVFGATPQVGPAVATPAPAVATPSPWREHVKSTYASLRTEDPTTTFKQAMVHAKASYRK
jgi:hypothetical protein